MSDPAKDLDQLAEDHHDYKLRTAPTWAHMIGEYRYSDRFENVSRDAEDASANDARALAERAELVALQAARAVLDDGRPISSDPSLDRDALRDRVR